MPEIFEHKYHLQYSDSEKVNSIGEIKHNGIRGTFQLLLEYSSQDYRFDVITWADVVKQSGLGTSSAFIVSLLNATTTLMWGKSKVLKMTQEDLARDSIYIERKLLAEPGGIQDGIFSAFGGLKSITIDKCGGFKVRPLSICDEFIREFKESLLLVYLGGSRQSYEISRSYEAPQADSNKHKIAEVAHEMLAAFQGENIPKIGECLHAGWIAKRGISNLISTSIVDEVYEKARGAGAWGGKVCGAGGSGFMLLVVPKDRSKNVLEAIDPYQNVGFDFDMSGSQVIFKGD